MTDMIPITYFPPAAQQRHAAAARAVRGTPYERYLATQMLVPAAAVEAVRSGPMRREQVLLPTVAELDRLFGDDYATAIAGYTVVDDSLLCVQSRVAFPGSTAEMFDWWFHWHPLDPRRYMLWFPYSHIEVRPVDAGRLADERLTHPERLYGNKQHVVELMGAEHFEAVIDFCAPAALGIDERRFQAAGFRASASGRLEMPGAPGVTVGVMLHFVRASGPGLELVSHYFLGSHPSLARFPGADKSADLFRAAGIDAKKLEATAYELSVHDMTEWNNLARLLPSLHAEFGPHAAARAAKLGSG